MGTNRIGYVYRSYKCHLYGLAFSFLCLNLPELSCTHHQAHNPSPRLIPHSGTHIERTRERKKKASIISSIPIRYMNRVRQPIFNPIKQQSLLEKAGNLSLSTPDTLQISIALGKTVEGVISLAASAHKSAERIDAVLAGVAAVLVNVADGDLHGGVVVGFDDAVGSAAFAGDVAVIR